MLLNTGPVAYLRQGPCGLRGTRVGEAQNPGPCRNHDILCANTGGPPGLWRLRHEQFLGAAVVCVQEVGMDLREWQGFAKVAARDGYKSYFTPGSSSVDKWNNV